MKKNIRLLGLGLSLLAITSCAKASEFDASKNITVVAREDGSGTKSAFLEIIGLKGKSDPTGVIQATSTAAVLTEVSGNPYAIAYDSLGYVNDTVKMLKVDDIEATTANIKSGSYAISRPLNVVYKEATVNGSDLYKDYLSYINSAEVQTLITDNGYVSIVDSASAYTKTTEYTGNIKISGSTSLQPLMTKIATAYMAIQKNVVVEVSGGGSGTGYANAENGTSAFGMISEEFTLSKAASCTYKTVCKDGIAIIVNKKNTVESITKAQLADIYSPESDSITTWQQVIGA